MRHRYILFLLVIAHLIIVPWIHIGGEGAERLFAGFYLAGYNVEVPLTELDIRGEIFIQFVMSLIIRLCDLLSLPVSFSANIALYAFPLVNLTAIFFAYLLGSSLFNRKIGFYFSLLLGLSYQFWYFSNQTRLQPVCATLMLASVYFFWKSIQENSEWYWFVLWGLFSVFAFEAMYLAFLLPLFYLSFLILSKKFNWITKRGTWFGAGVGFLSFAPWFYLNTLHTGSPVGPILNLTAWGLRISLTTVTEIGYLAYFSYIGHIHFYLPFPNFIVFIYGVYVLLKSYIKVRCQAHLFALSYLFVVFGGMSLIVSYDIDWYSPILMPPLILFTSIGLCDVFTRINSSKKFKKHSSTLCSSAFLLSALAINQIHPLVVAHLEDSLIHFYSIEGILQGFAVPKIIAWSNLHELEPIIELLEAVGKAPKPAIFSVMVLLDYTLLALTVVLSLYVLFTKTSIFALMQRNRSRQK